MKNEIKHTSHSSYRCEYHIVFDPKYRRKVIYKTLRKDIGEIFRKLCNESGNYRGRSMPGSYPHVGEYPTVHEYSTVRGKAQEQECADAFR